MATPPFISSERGLQETLRGVASPGGSAALPAGIRSWADGRVLPEASRPFELIAIGCSKGGMYALQTIFSVFPADFPLPVVVVQHRFKTSDGALPGYLRRHSRLQVVDALDKQHIHGGTVYLAPANYHLLVERGELNLSIDEAVAYSRPSIDVLFESAADAYAERVVAVILTGANNDGTRGATRIRRRGGLVVVQDPATAEAPEMPQAAIAAAAVDRILPLDRIGPFLVELCRLRS